MKKTFTLVFAAAFGFISLYAADGDIPADVKGDANNPTFIDYASCPVDWTDTSKDRINKPTTDISRSRSDKLIASDTYFNYYQALDAQGNPIDSLVAEPQAEIAKLKDAKEITIPESFTVGGNTYYVNDIAPNSLQDFTKLETLTIPRTVANIGTNACKGCVSLKNLVIEGGADASRLTQIQSGAFQGCVSLVAFEMGPVTKHIGTAAFKGSTELKSVRLNDEIDYLGDNIFQDCTELSEVNWPQGLTHIGNGCFQNTGLTSLHMPPTLTYIGQNAFSGCTKLRDLKMTSAINGIADGAFSDCTSLESIDMMNTAVTYLFPSVFENCTNLKYITLPQNLHTLGDKAFDGCENIIAINCPMTTPPWGNVNVFPDNVYKQATIYYDSASDQGYRNTQPWSLFQKQDSNGLSGIADVEADDNTEAEYYDLRGIRVTDPQPGSLLIMRRGAEVTKIIY